MDDDSEYPTRRAAIGTIGVAAATTAAALQVPTLVPATAAPRTETLRGSNEQPQRGTPVLQRGCI